MRRFFKDIVNGVTGFNPRIRDGCEEALSEDSEALEVSIHASVMDANKITYCIFFICTVSIHASVMDAKLNMKKV